MAFDQGFCDFNIVEQFRGQTFTLALGNIAPFTLTSWATSSMGRKYCGPLYFICVLKIWMVGTLTK